MLAWVLASGAAATLYAMQCATCHGTSLQGTALAPPLLKVSAAAVDFMLTTGRMPARIPSAQAEQRPSALSGAQIRQLVDYISQRSGGSTSLPQVDPTAGDIVRGRSMFVANCAACHGAFAEGGAVGYSWNAPSLERATPLQVVEAIRVGPGAMPSFAASQLSKGDVADIVRYVGFLQTQQPAGLGGLALGGVGPFAEGAVGWAIGLVLIVIAARWIGTRS